MNAKMINNQEEKEEDHQKQTEIRFLYVLQNKETHLIVKNLKKDDFVEQDSFDFKYWKTKEKAKEALAKYVQAFQVYNKKLNILKIEFDMDEEDFYEKLEELKEYINYDNDIKLYNIADDDELDFLEED